jgi:hypothetical protein
MTTTIRRHPGTVQDLSPVDQLADHIRRRSAPWPVRQLARRHNIRPHVAAVAAEALGLFTGEAGR